MNQRNVLPMVALLSFSLFGCKKNSSPDDTTPTPILQATIGGISWQPDTVSASITYNTTTKIKTFYFKGTKAQKQIEISIQDSNPVENQNFSDGNYVADANGNNTIIYSTQEKDSHGTYIFEPFGLVLPGNGMVNVTAIDSAAKTISGTFYYNASKNNYDANGNLISVDVAAINAGSFTKLPFKQERQ